MRVDERRVSSRDSASIVVDVLRTVRDSISRDPVFREHSTVNLTMFGSGKRRLLTEMTHGELVANLIALFVIGALLVIGGAIKLAHSRDPGYRWIILAWLLLVVALCSAGCWPILRELRRRHK